MLTREDILKVAALARIEIKDEEVEKFQKGLSAVLEYVEELKQVNVEGLEEVSQVTGLVNVQREDTVKTTEHREDVLKLAPETKDGYYKVKSIL